MKTYYAIGLMSGTSLDGLDICYAKFIEQGNWSFEIIVAETISYSKYWKQKLQDALDLSAENLLILDQEYGRYLGEKTKEFISKHQINQLDVIASHGHTVFHQPQKKITLQIGDARSVKLATQKTVVYDFRRQDVLMGGHGAPLVPIGDEKLFSQYDACLNLGGFSNISLKKNNLRIAFDICPVNVVLNHCAEKLNQPFDKEGQWARKGVIDLGLLKVLNALPYYQKSFPKSLGIEMVHQEIFPCLAENKPENILATYTEHIAQQIAKISDEYSLENILISGGGALNTYLVEKIKEKTTAQIVIPEEKIIHFKEALIFAFMGILRIRNEVNVLCSATGSSQDHSSGIIA